MLVQIYAVSITIRVVVSLKNLYRQISVFQSSSTCSMTPDLLAAWLCTSGIDMEI